MDLYFINSFRNKTCLVFEGNIYHKDRIRNDTSYWRCSQKSCYARITLKDNKFYKSGGSPHNHEAKSNDINLLKFKNSVINNIKSNPTTPIPRIYKDELAKAAVDVEAAAALPNFNSVRTSFYKVRSSLRPNLPNKLNELVLTEPFRKTNEGKEFLLIDAQESSSRILVFCTKDNLKILCESKRLFMDGTFKLVPKIFAQMYSIHAHWMDQVIPVAYCLLPDKRKLTYMAVLENLKQAAVKCNLTFNPSWIMVDFESSTIAALNEVFPNTQIKGCYFHFTQCIWRKVQQMGLTCLYAENIFVRRWIRRLAALPLVPLSEIGNAFVWIQNTAPRAVQNEIVVKFHDYVVETYIDECEALFTPDIWNHYDNVNERTNNYVEGWHSSFNKRSRTSHVNIFSFIELLKKDEEDTSAKLRMLQAGNIYSTKKRKYERLDEKLNNLKKRLSSKEIPLTNYIDAVSYCIHFEL